MSSAENFVVREKDGSGRVTGFYTSASPQSHCQAETVPLPPYRGSSRSWNHFLGDVFLPEGYPATVSEDYLAYQIWNALQAFCSSLASLFASRAVLQAHGVGNASASATNAILLTVIQDVFSRLTTIASGYYLGTSLSPEAKTYRLLADVLNDAAILTDTLSPHLATLSLSPHFPFLVPTPAAGAASPLRIVALCASGALRALCGAVAGGSKAALTVHFASAGVRPGDLGDLNAKDGSKETVLALLGMLCGSVVVHYVHSARATYTVLFMLIAGHLAANLMAVRVVAMHTFNRQRASIAWEAYRRSLDDEAEPCEDSSPKVPSPSAVAQHERIFVNSAWIGPSRSTHCVLGAPFTAVVGSLSTTQITALLATFSADKYVLWASTCTPGASMRIAVGLKEGHGPHDHMRAWAHAHELARAHASIGTEAFGERLAAVHRAGAMVARASPGFMEAARRAGWRVDEGALVGGSPATLVVELSDFVGNEDKKNI